MKRRRLMGIILVALLLVGMFAPMRAAAQDSISVVQSKAALNLTGTTGQSTAHLLIDNPTTTDMSASLVGWLDDGTRVSVGCKQALGLGAGCAGSAASPDQIKGRCQAFSTGVTLPRERSVAVDLCFDVSKANASVGRIQLLGTAGALPTVEADITRSPSGWTLFWTLLGPAILLLLLGITVLVRWTILTTPNTRVCGVV
jgi:hypothetical protein